MNVICFGDSNTYGYDPHGYFGGRYDADSRWVDILAGETGWLLDRRNPVLRDFHAALTQQMLLPQVLLTYHREAYALDGMDLWVALDSDIRATLQHMDFLDPDLLARDTADQTGRMLLSISYSRAIPDELLCLLEETAPRRRLLPGERGPV